SADSGSTGAFSCIRANTPAAATDLIFGIPTPVLPNEKRSQKTRPSVSCPRRRGCLFCITRADQQRERSGTSGRKDEITQRRTVHRARRRRARDASVRHLQEAILGEGRNGI